MTLTIFIADLIRLGIALGIVSAVLLFMFVVAKITEAKPSTAPQESLGELARRELLLRTLVANGASKAELLSCSTPRNWIFTREILDAVAAKETS